MALAFTISVAGLDFALRGAHVLPLEKIIGLDVPDETAVDSHVMEALEMDMVSHGLTENR